MRMLILGALMIFPVLLAACAGGGVAVREPILGTGAVVAVDTGPPAPLAPVVVKPRRPGPKYIWVDGHYVHSGGRYHWRKGHWANPPRRGQVWVPGHHVPGRGWVRGHWR